MTFKHLLLVLTLALPTVAFANDCPNLMAEIDAALAAAPQLDEGTKKAVMDLRSIGAEQHAAGNHDESEAALTEALELLGKS